MKVLLVHGLIIYFTILKELWANLLKFFEGKGFEFFIANLSDGKPTKQSVRVYLKKLEKQINEIKPDVIIAHSLGGMLVRWLIQKGLIEAPKKLILLEAPKYLYVWQLLWFGVKKLWEIFSELLAGSWFTKELAENTHLEPVERYVQFGGNYYLLVWWLFRIRGVRVKFFLFVGHYMMDYQRPLKYIEKILNSIET